MGGIIACICCYCCLTGLKPRIIEFLALLCNLVEIGFLIWGIIDIPWDDISTGGKIMYYITCGAIVVTFLLLLLLMCLRCGNTINTTKNDLGKCLCITMVVFDILAFILIIIAEIIIIYNMDDKDDDYNYNNGYYDVLIMTYQGTLKRKLERYDKHTKFNIGDECTIRRINGFYYLVP